MIGNLVIAYAFAGSFLAGHWWKDSNWPIGGNGRFRRAIGFGSFLVMAVILGPAIYVGHLLLNAARADRRKG